MLDARRKLLAGLALLLAGGGLLGWLYDRPVLGLLVAALLALVWQVRQMLIFERALRSGDFDPIREHPGYQRLIRDLKMREYAFGRRHSLA